jgi:hypothetical protein
MGRIEDVAERFDGTGWLEVLQRHSIEWLAQLAEAQARLLELEIRTKFADEGEADYTSPVASILAIVRETRAYQPPDEAKIGAQVDTAVKGLLPHAAPSVADAIAGSASKILHTFLTAVEADSGMFNNNTFVMSDGDSLVRVDLAAWSKMIGDDSIRAKMERLTAFVAVKASIDLSRLDFNAFRFAYELQLRHGGMDEAHIAEAVEEARKIHERGAGFHNP